MTKVRKITTNLILLPALLAISALPACLAATGYKINHFQTGKVLVDGKVYRYDIVITPDGTVHHAQGDEHMIYFDDIEEFISLPGIKTLLIGAGTEDKVKLDEELPDQLKTMGIEIKKMSTGDAIKMMNRTPKEGVITILHLNC